MRVLRGATGLRQHWVIGWDQHLPMEGRPSRLLDPLRAVQVQQ